MRKITHSLAAAVFVSGSLLSAAGAHAADRSVTPDVQGPPGVQAFDCNGGTGIHGCGPGWFWRDGWKGWACYVC